MTDTVEPNPGPEPAAEPMGSPRRTVSVTEAIRAPLQSENWPGNLLWLSLAAVTSSFFVGYIALFGYGTELFQRRAARTNHPGLDIDANRLGEYFTQGIWPFVVYFVVQIVLSTLLFIPLGIIFGIGMLAAAEGIATDATVGVLLAGGGVGSALLSVVSYLIAAPILIRAMVYQDFGKAFDWDWSVDFLSKMKWIIVGSGIRFALASLLVMLIGYLLFCIGAVPATGLLLAGMLHLSAQWYEVYLEQGGIPLLADRPNDEEVIEAAIVD
ncbi:MAG: DUF4013 domain-containing protein [Aureliella sp.]